MNSPPFVLFVLDKDIDNKYINKVLGSANSWGPEANWDLWLATNSYEDMPKDPPDRLQPDGSVLPPVQVTKPPVSNSYISPWSGKTVEDCAKWLQGAPEDVASDKRHFAALNEFSKEDNTVLLCRIKDDGGNVKLDYFPLNTKWIACYLYTNSGDRFEESFGGYQREMEDEGKPDRSQGGPYS